MMSIRRLFHIHLSTAVGLMFLASALLWANLNEYKCSEIIDQHFLCFSDDIFDGIFYGFPVHFCQIFAGNPAQGLEPFKRWSISALVFDCLLWFIIVLVFALFCELLSRLNKRNAT